MKFSTCKHKFCPFMHFRLQGGVKRLKINSEGGHVAYEIKKEKSAEQYTSKCLTLCTSLTICVG